MNLDALPLDVLVPTGLIIAALLWATYGIVRWHEHREDAALGAVVDRGRISARRHRRSIRVRDRVDDGAARSRSGLSSVHGDHGHRRHDERIGDGGRSGVLLGAAPAIDRDGGAR